MMALQLWKVKREILRAWGRVRVGVWKRLNGKTHVQYFGLQVPLRRTGMDDGVLLAIARNNYEVPEITGVRQVVKPGDRVLELGSGLGVVTAIAAQSCAPDGAVLSFDANADMIPDTVKFLFDHNITNVDIRHSVLVPDSGPGNTREFFLNKSFASSSLREQKSRALLRSIQVPTVNANKLIGEFRPDILVCDIEGAEAELIPALSFDTFRAVVIELHPDRLEKREIEGIYDAFQRNGFEEGRIQLGGTVKLFERIRE